MITETLNLWIKQGETFNLSITVLEAISLRVTSAVEAGGTSIPIKPAKDPIASGRKILFGNDVFVTLSTPVVVGATSLSVVQTDLPIAKNTTGYLVADLTGCTVRSQYKGKLIPAPRQLSASFASDRLSGGIVLSLSATETTAIPANLGVGTILSDDDLTNRNRQDKDYDWDWELVFPDGTVRSPHKGLIVVYPEVTVIS